MSKPAQFALLPFLLFSPAAAAPADHVLAHWVQLGPGGISDVRATVSGHSCPKLGLKHGADLPMTVRASESDAFVRVCSISLPSSAEGASIKPDGFAEDAGQSGWVLPPVVAQPKRILVLGDTGCRIKPPAVQDCNDVTK